MNRNAQGAGTFLPTFLSQPPTMRDPRIPSILSAFFFRAGTQKSPAPLQPQEKKEEKGELMSTY